MADEEEKNREVEKDEEKSREVTKKKDEEELEKKEGEKPAEEVPKENIQPVQKDSSKLGATSKSSLKKGTDSPSESSESETSAMSMGMKRQSEYEKMMKGPRYQNTYRLDPKKPFKPREVYKVIEEIVLKEIADFHQYDSFAASRMVQNIAAEVRTSVKLFNYDRYKICVLVILGEKRLQGYQCAFRALWDQERDGWTTYFYQCRSYFLSCTCYGLYHD